VEPNGATPEEICEKFFGGDWFDDLECGGAPIPAMPRAGQAALVLILLVGALVILSWRGSISAG